MFDNSSEVFINGKEAVRATPVILALKEKVLAQKNITVLCDAKAISWHIEERTLIAIQPDIRWDIQPKSLVIATGSYETPALFADGDLPGIMLSRAAMRLMHRDFIRPGKTVHVHLSETANEGIAQQCIEAGLVVSGLSTELVADETMKDFGIKHNIPVYERTKISQAHGKKHVSSISLFKGASNKPIKSKCDCLIVKGPTYPANELAYQATSSGEIIEGNFELTYKNKPSEIQVSNGIFIVGRAASCSAPHITSHQAKLAGALSAQAAGKTVSQEEIDTIRALLAKED